MAKQSRPKKSKNKKAGLPEEVLENPGLLRPIIEGLPQGFALFDPDDRLILYNKKYLKLSVLKKSDIAGNPHFKDMARMAAETSKIVDAKGNSESWVRKRMKLHRNPNKPFIVNQNNKRWVKIHEQRTKQGYTTINYEDVTETIKTAENLRESEERFRDFTRSASDWIWETGPDLKYTHLSGQFFETHNIKPKGIIGKTRWEYVDSDVMGQNPEMWQKHKADMKARRPFSDFVYQFKVPNGTTRYININGKPVFDPKGKFLGYRGTGADVTDRKQVEEALRASEERYALVTRATDEGIMDWDIRTNRLFVSERYEQIIGVANITKATKKAIYGNIHPDDHDHYRETMIRHLKGKTPLFECEFRLRDRGAGIRWARMRALALRDGKGRAYRMTGSIGDITKRKQVEDDLIEAKEQAEIANRTKTDFLANVSHELRTPLNAIIGFSDMISSEIFGSLNNPKYADYTKTISDSGQHLLSIINDILDIARLEVGKIDFRPEPVNVSDVVQASLRLVRERADTAGLTIKKSIKGKLPAVRGDERRLKQMLLNLLSNAVKFTPRGGVVTVRARMSKAGNLVLGVTDTGIGMTVENIKEVMKPFVQVDSKLARKYEGTGLGLPLTKSFAELHGATMKIKSTPGKGTVITVTFPPETLLA